MKQIYQNLFIGDEKDYENDVKYQEAWSVVHACKEPYHRQALGYAGRACSKDNPEYLVARRGDHLILNLVDVDNPDWISPIIIDTAIEFIFEQLERGHKVLVHCNQGHSRSAGIGLLFLAYMGLYKDSSFLDAEKAYSIIYPAYNPAAGIRDYCMSNWLKYCNKELR